MAEDPRFDYQRYQTPGITVATLDKLASSVFDPNGNTGWVAIAWGGFKLVMALAYIWARDKLVSQQQLLEKQQYEASHATGNQSEVNAQDPTTH